MLKRDAPGALSKFRGGRRGYQVLTIDGSYGEGSGQIRSTAELPTPRVCP